jgi:anti-anti-sigma factor
MKMTIVPRADDITHIILTGRLDSNGAEEISESFFQATVARSQSAIVDLSEVDFMVSRGIGIFLINGSKLRKAGHMLVVLNPQALVKDGLRTTRADTVTPIASDWDEAIRIVHGVSAPATAPNRQLEAAADKIRGQCNRAIARVSSVLKASVKHEIKNEISELKNVMATLTQFFEAHRVLPPRRIRCESGGRRIGCERDPLRTWMMIRTSSISTSRFEANRSFSALWTTADLSIRAPDPHST